MFDDFVLSRSGGRWQITALSERAKALAADHPRFDGGKAELDEGEALAVYQKIHDKGLYVGAPDGLPPAAPAQVFSRLGLAAGLIGIPLLIYVLFGS